MFAIKLGALESQRPCYYSELHFDTRILYTWKLLRWLGLFESGRCNAGNREGQGRKARRRVRSVRGRRCRCRCHRCSKDSVLLLDMLLLELRLLLPNALTFI